MIWACSTVSVLDNDADNDAHKLFAEILKNIDELLNRALQEGEDWEKNLIYFDATTTMDATPSGFMYKLLSGRCNGLAQNRVHAINDKRSITHHLESLANGTETKDTIKTKVKEEVKTAKEAGLNFNVLCNFWLCK